MSEEIDKHVQRKYDVQQKLGKGAYGIVWRALDKKTKETLALKKVFDAFQNSTDAQRTYREVVYLLQMSHENIVQLRHVLKAENDKDIYLVFEYMETDLHATIRANILEEIHKQYIMYQAFKALLYMHSAGLVHRDMKPANLLLNSECLMKVADFGLARSVSARDAGAPDQGDNMTDYVATRWYRAPEILVGSSKYGFEADLWSLGCIFGEMINGKQVFGGSSTLNQVEVICELLDRPDDETIESLDSQFAKSMYDNVHISDTTRKSIEETPKLAERFQKKFPSASEDAIDLLMQLLRYDPTKRIQPRAGLTHEYCVQFHDPETEIVSNKTVGTNPDAADAGFFDAITENSGVQRGDFMSGVTDNKKIQTQQYRDMLYGICHAKSDAFAKSARRSERP